MRLFPALVVVVGLLGIAERAHAIEPKAIENATFQDLSAGDPNPALVKAQILLERARFSPGAFDGKAGDNTKLAIKAFQQDRDLEPTGDIDQRTWDALARADEQGVLQEYEITAKGRKFNLSTDDHGSEMITPPRAGQLR